MFKKRYVRNAWAHTWRIMLGKNIFACLRDTAAGVDAIRGGPARTAAARTGPHPPLGIRGDVDGEYISQPRRLDGNTVGTISTPLAVLPPRPEAVGFNPNV